MKSVLVLCIGNICRSPMAQGLMSKELPEVLVNSAGIGALVGQPPDENAQEIMLQNGVDISKHRAQQVSQILCNQSDIILVMDTEQKRFIERQYPLIRGKVFKIANADIGDPYKKNIQAFADAFSLIEEGALKWIDRIKKL